MQGTEWTEAQAKCKSVTYEETELTLPSGTCFKEVSSRGGTSPEAQMWESPVDPTLSPNYTATTLQRDQVTESMTPGY